MPALSRRGFLAASAASAATLALPARLFAQDGGLTLTATSRVIDVRGQAATVWGLQDGAGRSGLVLDPGQRFAVSLTNGLAEPTIVHWHGQIPDHAQDGVPDMPMPPLQPGETRAYDFAARPGTHWMHSHIPVQEMQLLAAPLIVRRPEDLAADRQEVTLFLHDFAFAPAEEVLATITGGMAMDHSHMDHSAMGHGSMDMSGSEMSGMDMSGMMAMGAMDLNDFHFDAYLTNDRTLHDPEVVPVEASGRVLLRVINASAATAYWIDTGTLPATLVAVDGEPVQPLPGTRFGLAMGQRLDITLEVLPEGGAFPILALREGARERTGLILATPGAQVAKLAELSDAAHPAFAADLAQEASLRAVTPLAERPATKTQMLMLGGGMMPYLWTIDGQTWEGHVPVTAKSGERVELTFHNMSMMAHPMHLHGHVFQVVGLNGQRFAGALRDTVNVPPGAMVTVALDAGEAARWMLHCHHMPHLSTGMMTEFAVSA